MNYDITSQWNTPNKSYYITTITPMTCFSFQPYSKCTFIRTISATKSNLLAINLSCSSNFLCSRSNKCSCLLDIKWQMIIDSIFSPYYDVPEQKKTPWHKYSNLSSQTPLKGTVFFSSIKHPAKSIPHNKSRIKTNSQSLRLRPSNDPQFAYLNCVQLPLHRGRSNLSLECEKKNEKLNINS